MNTKRTTSVASPLQAPSPIATHKQPSFKARHDALLRARSRGKKPGGTLAALDEFRDFLKRLEKGEIAALLDKWSDEATAFYSGLVAWAHPEADSIRRLGSRGFLQTAFWPLWLDKDAPWHDHEAIADILRDKMVRAGLEWAVCRELADTFKKMKYPKWMADIFDNEAQHRAPSWSDGVSVPIRPHRASPEGKSLKPKRKKPANTPHRTPYEYRTLEAGVYPVLSIRAEYAEEIVLGMKREEYRSWKPRRLGPIALHACGQESFPRAPAGHILGIMDIVAVEGDEDDCAWVIGSYTPLETPVRTRGFQGIWPSPVPLVPKKSPAWKIESF